MAMRFVVGAMLLSLVGGVATADSLPVRQVSAPVIRSVSMPPFVLGEGGIRVVDAGHSEIAMPSPAAMPFAVLSRGSFKAQLADFAALTAAISGSFVAGGVQLDNVAPSSAFAAAGLRAGDKVVSVDGKPLAKLDDVADLYARAADATAANVGIVRDGKPMSLRVVIR